MRTYLALTGAMLLAGRTILATSAQAATPLPAPENLRGTVADGRASLDWDAVPGARDYLVFDISQGEPGRVVGATRGTDWISARLPGRPEFSFQVVARDPVKLQGERSETVTLYPNGQPDPDPEPPVEEPTDPEPEPVNIVPQNLTATAQADRRVVLNWDDVEGATAYRIYEPRTTGPVTTVTESTRTSPALAPGDYVYTVTAVVNGVESARSNEARVTVLAESTTPTDPPPPTDPEPPVEEPTDPEPPATGFVPQPPREGPVNLGAAVSWQRLQDPVYRNTFLNYFDGGVAENDMKTRNMWPERNRYNFATADALVDFLVANDKYVRGHTLFWHGANPSWITSGSFTQAEWRGFIQQYATDAVGHFRGRVDEWDVLNEIVAEDGSGLRTDNPWVNGHGGDPIDAIELMFRAAHAADPEAKLYLNDFSVEFNRPKTQAYLSLARTLVERGVPIHGIGFQSHLITESEGPGTSDPGGWSPTVAEWTGILQQFADLGLQVSLTEVDFKTSPTPGDVDTKLAAHADMARIAAQACQNVDRCVNDFWWGIPDNHSWLYNNGAELPLLFHPTSRVENGMYVPKPAYWATREVIGGGPGAPAEPEPPVEEPTDPDPTDPTLAEPNRAWAVQPGQSVFGTWPEIHAPTHERVQVSTEQVRGSDRASLRFETRRSDPQGNPGANSTWNVGNTGTRRAEVRDSISASGSPTEGTEQWWGWSTFFPSDFNWDERNQFFGFMQFHQTANSGNPPVHFWSDDQENMWLDVRGGTGGRTGGDAQYTERFNLGPINKGAWNDIVFHVVWSSNPNVGLVEVYRGGQRVLSENAANLYVTQSAYVKQGIYSANGVAVPVHVIYTSTTRLGDSYEEVAPR